MSEALDTSTTEPVETAPVESTEAPPAAAEPSEWDDPEPLDEKLQQFDRKYVEELRDREAKYRIRARDQHELLEGFGGKDEVEKAVKVLRDLGTEEGTIKFFIEAGQNLGLNFKQMEALFEESDALTTAEAEATAEATAPKDDDLMTYAEAKRLLQSEVLEPQRQAEEQRILAVAQATVQGALQDVPKEDHAAVLALGQSHIADGDFDPEHIRAAVRKGNEEFQAAKQRDREAYLAEKLKDLETVPASTGAAGAPGGEAPPPPANWEEAKKRARARIAAEASR